MNHCDSVRDQLDAFQEGLVDDDDARAIDRHLSGCADCREFLEHSQLIGDRLHDIAEREWRAPDGLWRRIEHSYANEIAGSSTGDGPKNRPFQWAVAALLAITVGLTTVLLIPGNRLSPHDAAATALVNEFHTFVVSQRDLDYDQVEPRAIRDWFGDKVDFRVPLPIRPAGFDLSGGRLCNLLDQRIVSFMYLDDGAWISLYIFKPVDGEAGYAESEEWLVRGYGYIQWVHDGLQYSLVGDIPVERLRRFADGLSQEQPVVIYRVLPMMTLLEPQTFNGDIA